MNDDPDNSLSDAATFAGRPRPQRADVSLSDGRTLGGAASGQDTIIDDIEVVDLEARYRIDGTLGQGGMGAVLLATDTRLDRRVAIKRILGEAAGNRMAVSRFLTEAKSIAALNHPNIVQIYDYGQAKDGPFLIMEFVDGGSLLDRCRAGGMPLESAVDLACQLCDGLAKAHDLGIIHRDIKPANVLLTKDGIPKLTDFGLAKVQAGDHGQTMTGAVLGTPDFMPPEQRKDAALVDRRSDLWSLAATVYQMVTGRSPKIIRFKDMPESLQDVLGKALEDEKDSRYQSARDLRDAIRDAFLQSPHLHTREGMRDEQVNLESGECPKCHVRNESQRKFCRECAASLRWACLSCEQQIPVWEKICPECGTKQHELLTARREKLDQQREEAEASLRGLRYEAAIASAQAAHVPNDDRFTHYGAWREKFISDTKAEQQTAIADRAAKLEQARRHRAAFDYNSAIYAMESIPEQLRFFDGSQFLATLRAENEEAASLLGTLRGRIDSKQLDGMIPLVQRAIQLRGDRKDLPPLMDRLVDREALLASRERKQRDWVVATFQKAIGCFQMQGEAKIVLDTLLPLRRLLTPEQDKQIAVIQEAVAAEQRLGELLALAKADGKIEPSETVDLAHAVVKCLSLVPKCQRLLTFRDQLLNRIARTPNEFVPYKSSLLGFFATLSTSSLEAVPSELREVVKSATSSPMSMTTAASGDAAVSATSTTSGVFVGRGGRHHMNSTAEPPTEGLCRSCATINTDLSRNFCRKCGNSLRTKCLACQAVIPVWDLICGECGGNQRQGRKKSAKSGGLSRRDQAKALVYGRPGDERIKCPSCGVECRADRLVQHFDRQHGRR